MRIDSSSERHHFVPQFILRNFSFRRKRADKIFILDKKSDKSFEMPVAEFASRNNFNSLFIGELFISLEGYFCDIENSVAPIISNILLNRNISGLSLSDKKAISIFVASLLLRGIQLRNDISVVLNRMHEISCNENWGNLGNLGNSSYYEKAIHEASKKISLKLHLERVLNLSEMLREKDMILLESAGGEFYFSDNPIALHNDNDFGPYGNLGVMLPGIQVNFPISSKLTLSYWCPTVARNLIRQLGTNNNFKFLLKNTNRTLLYKNDDVDECISGLNGSNEKIGKILSSIGNGIPLLCSIDVIEHLNFLQIAQSHRYIASRSNGFEFARRVLERSPKLRKGQRISV